MSRRSANNRPHAVLAISPLDRDARAADAVEATSE
ncbi:hypothetical protein FHS37_004390 [Streptomyces griseostramineus]|uniref:Uncharacterized protein n=1 Tax=Streptomyces griseomycini TaxID=66895 RepID=A0A7W7M2W2_9ACTN|nr:hypothetical protein [Streptomyces griseomycini]